MESLMTLLVLSIGMLGLGQLQARLWTHAGDIQRLEASRLASSNILELIEINRHFSSLTALDEASSSLDLLATFTYQTLTRPKGLILVSEVTVSWEQPSGADNFSLHSALYTGFNMEDARWLLTTAPE